MRKSKLLCFCYTALCLLLLISCTKDESILNPDLPISRLLVSSATTNPNSTSLSMFSPADLDNLGTPINFNMVNPNGNGIVYDNISNIGFQIGMLNKTIRTFSINTDGSLRIMNSFRDSTLTDGRGIAYNRSSNQLYVASSTDSLIHIYSNASNKTGNIISDKKLALPYQPWGIFYDSGKLLVVGDLEVKKILVINNISSVGSTIAASEIAIASATRLRGIAYSSKKDILILTDIGDVSLNSDGAIYIFEDFNNKLSANASISPTRTISGSATLLGNPVDVTFDDREGKDIIYIAEKANNKILGFKLSENGNQVPFLNANVSAPPESLWIDAR